MNGLEGCICVRFFYLYQTRLWRFQGAGSLYLQNPISFVTLSGERVRRVLVQVEINR